MYCFLGTYYSVGVSTFKRMKKLSISEVKEQVVVGRGRMSLLANSKLFNETKSLKVGEAILISVNEWPLKSMPNAVILNVAHKKSGIKFSCKQLPMKKGYVFIRIL